MNQKSFVKRIAAAALCLIMMMGLLPMYANAATTSVPGAEGHVLTDMVTATFTDGYDSTIFVYVTPNASDSIQYHMHSNGHYGIFAVPAYDQETWYFDGWRTWYKGSHSGAGLINSDKANPKYDDTYNYFEESANGFQSEVGSEYVYFPPRTVRVRKETLWKGTYYLSAVFKPIVTIHAGNGITYAFNSADSNKVRDGKYGVKYQNTATVSYEVDDAYIATSIGVNGTGYNASNGAVFLESIVRPVTVSISTRLKQQTINFDANGGSGTMASQTFEHSVAQTLTANSFTRTGYRFDGWNTSANGSGTAYEDKVSATFAPVNDGDSVTLYAQWAECTEHSWVDGKCELCEMVCSHSGGNATCTEQATCGICGQKYGEMPGHKDINTDHSCDYNCGETNMGEHIDLDHDHSCDYGCFTLIGIHADGDDANHTCDYCGKAVDGDICVDGDTDHACDECGAQMGTHADGDDTDHTCDYCNGTVEGDVCVDADTDHACDECGAPMGIHEQASGKHTCDYCGVKMSECTGGTATCTQRALCEICGAEYGELLEHSYGAEWESDKDNHYHACSCGEKADTAKHTEKVINAKEATTTEKGYTGDTVCAVCGYEMAKGEDIPIKTGPATPNSNTPSTPQTGDTENITLWLTLMILSGIALISLFTRSKERRNIL